jgi:hypothetical protein
MSITRSVLLFAVLTTPLMAAAAPQSAAEHLSHDGDASSALVQKVRTATEGFRDATQVPAGYQSVLGCVSGPDAGAMGVHFVNGALLSDDVLNPDQPEALIYEFRGGIGRLVGVEFIVFADVWHLTHAKNDPPVLDGQLLNFYDAPNRFGLPAFYELHVWAWRDNPNGAFVDWNPRVSCEGR